MRWEAPVSFPLRAPALENVSCQRETEQSPPPTAQDPLPDPSHQGLSACLDSQGHWASTCELQFARLSRRTALRRSQPPWPVSPLPTWETHPSGSFGTWESIGHVPGGSKEIAAPGFHSCQPPGHGFTPPKSQSSGTVSHRFPDDLDFWLVFPLSSQPIERSILSVMGPPHCLWASWSLWAQSPLICSLTPWCQLPGDAGS